MVETRSVCIAPATAVALEHGRLVGEPHATSPLAAEFAATLSHEIRTPLNSITGYSEMLTDATLEPYSSQWDDVIDRIQRSVGDLLAGVSRTLDFVRLSADGLVPASNRQDTT